MFLKKCIFICLLSLFTCGLLFEAQAAESDYAQIGARPNQLLVKFEKTVTENARQQLIQQWGAAVLKKIGFIDVYQLKVASNTAPATLIQTIKKSAGVLWAEPNYIYSVTRTPNDPQFSSLYGLHNIGQTGGKLDADIDATEAWEITTGSDDVIIAVIDTGIDTAHPDLAANMWTNSGEIAGNGTDDDGNGYIDDIHGFDFYWNDGDPYDDYGHGTHVAGTIGAVGDNNQGVVGVAWKVKIMGLKFLGPDGYGDASTAALCVEYGIKNGARVLSNSWGGGPYSQALYDSIVAANQAGVTFVAAAGNYGYDNNYSDFYPATMDVENVISIAATDSYDQLAYFSNYGSESVELAAPGVGILSTFPGGGYMSFDGTSMATPHVSGALALLLSVRPELTPLEQIEILKNSVDTIPALNGMVITGGRLNVNKALELAMSGDFIVISPKSIVLKIDESVNFDAHGGTPPYRWSVENETVGTIEPTGKFTAKTLGTTKIFATDAKDHVASASVTVTDIELTITGPTSPIFVSNVVTFSVSGGTAPYTWQVTDGNVGSIDSYGQFTALAVGTTTITADDSLGHHGELAVEVFVSGDLPLTLLPTDLYRVEVHKSYLFEASGGVWPYTFDVSDRRVATIGDDGRLWVKNPGTFNVQVTDAVGNVVISQEIKAVRLMIGCSAVNAETRNIAPASYLLMSLILGFLGFIRRTR